MRYIFRNVKNPAWKYDATSHLCVKSLAGFDGVVWVTKDKAFGHRVLLDSFDLDLDVLPTRDFGHFDVVRPQLVDLHVCPVGVNCQSLTWNTVQKMWWLSACQFGTLEMVLPLRHSPDSTFPIRMVPMSENLSTIGIMKGPPMFRFKGGRESMYGMNDSPLEKKNTINACWASNLLPHQAAIIFRLSAVPWHAISSGHSYGP